MTQRTGILLGALLFALLPLSTDIYLAVMAQMSADFPQTPAAAARSMLAFTIGFGGAHLIIGWLADRFGRRPVAIGGAILFTLASIFAAMAQELDVLLFARFLQGLSAACGPILARTLIRDTFHPDSAGRALSAMGAITGIAPLTAPIIGTVAASFGGWRAALWVLAVYGAVLIGAMILGLGETRPADARAPGSPLSVFRVLGRLLRTGSFVRGVLAFAFGYGALFTWLTNGPPYLVGDLGLTPFHVSLIYGLGSGGYLVGSMIAMRLARRFRLHQILMIGVLMSTLGPVLAMLAMQAGVRHWAGLLVAILPFYLSWGLCQPNLIALSMRAFPDIAGQASAWLGAFQQLGGFLIAALAVRLGGGMAAMQVMTLGCLGMLAFVSVEVFFEARARRQAGLL